MINSKHYLDHPRYRSNAFNSCKGDHPVIVQFCGNDADILLNAVNALRSEDGGGLFVDGIDLNFGCPQNIAKRGHYGAYLLDDVDLMTSLISKLRKHLKIAICAKIRILPNIESTIKMCLRLRDAGCCMLTVHGRTVECKKERIGGCDFESIR